MSTLPEFARALLDPQAATPPRLRAWNGSEPSPRFDVHRNNVVASLVRALEEGFPVTCQLVGETFFRAMAREYVRAEPPVSPVLLEYGTGLAAFIDTFAPAASVAYLGDMARLERARVEAFNAADADPLAPGDFASMLQAPERLMQSRVALHPSLRVLSLRHRVLALWQAHQPGGGHALDAAREGAAGGGGEDLAVLRPAQEVRAQVLPAGAASMFDALAQAQTLGAALERAAADPDFQLEAAVAVLVHGGAAVALHP